MKKHLLLASAFLLSFPASIRAQTTWVKTKEELLFTTPPFQQCHASTLVEETGGNLLVAYFGGPYEGSKEVNIWLTTISKAGSVSQPRSVADGVVSDTLRYPTWNPVLFKAREGKLFLFYKVGPNPREWWGMVKTSADEGQTWSTPRRLPAGVLGPIKNKPVQLANGTILAPSSIEEKTERWKVHLEKSTDLGQTWQIIPVDNASTFDVIQPSILVYPGNRLQILCRSKQGSVVQAWSTDGGNTWGALSKTSLLNPNSGTDAVTLKDGSQLLVYNPDVPGKDWFNGRSKLRVAQSKDGQTWRDVAVLENGTKEEYSYPAIIQTRDGRVHITYTYDRKNIKHVVLQAK
ncbi:sialidase family protein [Hymenobacter sp. GOD-10R]|uniref:sialidase family protein n=1 Tax=Hymenobacter sp. GOD-10R TaxID=3093922 RepID=UPI002D77D904|nr:sialidase family protein [Hymenobacter sp. GOD-10R]WRQ30263.1 sialidase family protein [Hymenobacter sp. GOD-10R]